MNLANFIVSTLMLENIDPSEHGSEWRNEVVYHGTGRSHAAGIRGGIDIQKGCGYFGYAFYVADDPKLAKSNYADFADDEPAILMFRISPRARIADMRVEDELQEIFNRVSSQGRGLSDPGMPARMISAGVDGVYDRSVGGLAIYNPAVLIYLGEWTPGAK